MYYVSMFCLFLNVFRLSFKLKNLFLVCLLPCKISLWFLPFLKYFILQAIYFGPDEYRKPFDILVRSFAYPKLRISRFLSFHLNVCVFYFIFEEL